MRGAEKSKNKGRRHKFSTGALSNHTSTFPTCSRALVSLNGTKSSRNPCKKGRAASYSIQRSCFGSVRSIPSRAPLPVLSHRQFDATRTLARGNANPGGIDGDWHREILQHHQGLRLHSTG